MRRRLVPRPAAGAPPPPLLPCTAGGRNRRFPGGFREGAAEVRQRSRTGVREGARLLRRPLGVRAAHVRARGRRRRPRDRGLHARLLPPRAEPLPRDHGDEAAAGDAEEPQAAQAARPLSRGAREALLQARHRAAGPALPPGPSVIGSAPRVGEVFLSAEELRSRVEELGREISRDYEGRELLLVSLLKASFVFLTDISRAISLSHQIDFVELTGYNGADTGGHSRVRLLKDCAIPVSGLDVLLVEDVVDTGLTLNYLRKLLELRKPASLRSAALLERPYRRLGEDLPG